MIKFYFASLFVLFLSACSSKYGKKYDEAFVKTLENEGSYDNDPDDKGGETKYGICKRKYPEIDIKNVTIDQAKGIYYEDYWKILDIDSISSPEVAAKIFDMCVNFGPLQTKKIVKRAIRSVYNNKTVLGEDEDRWGETIFLLNSIADTKSLLVAMRSEAAAVYRMIANKDKTQEKFLKGWLIRAYG